jgi:hypothetical protein
MLRSYVGIALALLPALAAGADQPSAQPIPANLSAAPAGPTAVSLAARQILMESGRYGLKYFPDECLAFVRTVPKIRLLMAAGNSTSLLEGPDMKSLVPLGQVLKPGKPHAFDNGYAGIGGLARDLRTGTLLAFYHAEDHEDLPMIPGGIPGFYCSIALAASNNDGASFQKRGPVISGSLKKDVHGRADQGCGEMSILADKDQRYLYAYYSDHCRPGGRGVQICLARCPVEEAGATNRWRKYYGGRFDEPGLGGRDTPVVSAQAMHADAIFPHVTFVEKLNRYVMVFNLIVYKELATPARPERSGIYMACSRDGIRWSEPTQLLRIQSVPVRLGTEIGWHPTLRTTSVKGRTANGWLYYSYSESWGHRPPQKPHYLVGQPITFTIAEQ